MGAEGRSGDTRSKFCHGKEAALGNFHQEQIGDGGYRQEGVVGGWKGSKFEQICKGRERKHAADYHNENGADGQRHTGSAFEGVAHGANDE